MAAGRKLCCRRRKLASRGSSYKNKNRGVEPLIPCRRAAVALMLALLALPFSCMFAHDPRLGDVAHTVVSPALVVQEQLHRRGISSEFALYIGEAALLATHFICWNLVVSLCVWAYLRLRMRNHDQRSA